MRPQLLCAGAVRDIVQILFPVGHLVQVLPDYWQPANVWAVYVSRLATSAKIRTTVEFLRHYFQLHDPQHEPTASAVGRGD